MIAENAGRAQDARDASRLTDSPIPSSLQIDPGAALFQQRSQSVSALQRAVALDPDCADPRCSLADALEEIGDPEQARSHWETYLTLEPVGEWADHARRRLRSTASA